MFSGLKDFFTGPHDLAFYGRLAVYAIIILYMFSLGIPDLLRLSVKRIWAISGVCFSESIRRRVLWIIPLALVGLVFLLWFQQSWDPQEDIRQTTKFCLFTMGLVVVISTVILACTSLPKEIESRVIFTIVTKPTTRLEIVLGKITGFARMSATILLIMGLFTYGYLNVRAWVLQRDLHERLANNSVESLSKPTFDHYAQAGLLNAKSMASPLSMNIYQYPPSNQSKRRYPSPDGGLVLVPFQLPESTFAFIDPDGSSHQGPGMTVQIRVGYDRTEAKPPTTRPGTPPLPAKWTPPRVTFSVFDPNQNTALPTDIKGIPVAIPSADSSVPVSIDISPANVAALAKFPYFFIAVAFSGGDGEMWIEDDYSRKPVSLIVPVTSPMASIIPTDTGFRHGSVNFSLKGDAIQFTTKLEQLAPGTEYNLKIKQNGQNSTQSNTQSTTLGVLKSNADGKAELTGKVPVSGPADEKALAGLLGQSIVIEKAEGSAPVAEAIITLNATLSPIGQMVFTGREGVTGQQLKGDPSGKSQICVFHYPQLDLTPTADNQVPIECKIGVEKSGEVGDEDVPTQATVTVYDPKTGSESAPIAVMPENNRWFYTSVPASLVTDRDFDLRVRCLSDGQWLNLRRSSLFIVQEDHSFAWNLFKSTFIIWLLSILVTSIAVFCSTFLSWPIAVVATLMILFAHWGVDQLGDSASSGVGRSFVTEMGVKDPAAMHVVSDTVEGLNKALKQVSAILPDTDQFAATERIDHGINIPASTIGDAVLMLLGFGLPFSVLAYMILKNKEVAP